MDVAYVQWSTTVTGVEVKEQRIRDNKGSVIADFTVLAVIISDEKEPVQEYWVKPTAAYAIAIKKPAHGYVQRIRKTGDYVKQDMSNYKANTLCYLYFPLILYVITALSENLSMEFIT